MKKSERLRREAQTMIAKARAIAEKAQSESRELTDDEQAEFRKHFEAAQALNTQKDAALSDEDVLDQAKALGDMLGLGPEAAADLDAQASDPERTPEGKSLGEQITGSPQFKSLLAAFGNRPIPEKARVQSDPIPFRTLISGSKALFVGGSATSGGAFISPDRTGIVEMLGRPPLTIRDLISVRRTASDTVEYVVQTSHTNAAAPIAEATSSADPTSPGTAGPLVRNPAGGYKPEGAWAFAKATAPVRTIAEWVPATKRALADVAQLEGLINDELLADLAETEEAQILTGSGTGENLTGILNTSGIQTRAVGTDSLFDAVRKALTQARVTGRSAPSAIVVNPVQAEAIDLAKDTTNRYYGAGPFSFGPRTLWGVPLVESQAMTAGTALVGDFSKAVLWDREQSAVTMTDSHADFFIRNLVAILAEERVAFAVTRPSAFVTVTGL